MEEDPLFLPASFFMARTALLPIQDFFSFSEANDLKEKLFSRFENDPLFREAIGVASSSLYNSLLNKKYNEQTFSSLLKYFIRMSSRPTPFGLFSCVSLGKWSTETSAKLDLGSIYKKCRPDMKWLKLFLERLLKDFSLASRLAIKKNSSLIESSGRIFIENIYGTAGSEKRRTASIRNSFLIQSILNYTKTPDEVHSVIKKLIATYPNLDENKLENVFQKLIAEKFLVYDLFPSLLSESLFDIILAKLSSFTYPKMELEEISDQLKIYEKLPISQGEKKLNQIFSLMQNIADSQHVIQLDTAYSKEDTLPEKIAKELQKSTELLWQIGHVHNPYKPLFEYYEQFTEKYGTNRTIPLLELLNEDRGLGIPKSYLDLPSKQPEINRYEEKWNQWLKMRWAHCFQTKSQEIEIHEKEIQQMLPEIEKEKALFSFDLSCEVIANHPEDINQGNYLLKIFPFAWQGGASFGRFANILKPRAKSLLKSFFRNEESLDQESVFIETSFYDENSPRSANVTTVPHLRRDCLDLNGKGSISLDEIYIGANMTRLYATDEEGSKELRFTATHMLNPTSFPYPLRFLRDIHLSSQKLLLQFPWLDLEKAFFHPRIRYKNTILSPACWKLDLFILGCHKNDPIKKIERAFQLFAKDWNMPTFILLTDNDNRLLLNRNQPVHLREIVLELKKTKEIVLTEKIGQRNGQWVESSQGTHSSEFIIPFIKNPKYSSPKPFKPSKYTFFSNKDRLKIFGSDWVYLKCYMDSSLENPFLVEECNRFGQKCLEDGLIQGWFFIRYADPMPHLRIRFHVSKKEGLFDFISLMHEWSSELFTNQLIKNLILGTYDREIERYGGKHLIRKAEEFFCGDTQTTVELLKIIRENKISLSETVVTAISIIDLLRNFNLEFEEQLAFFDSLAMKKDDLAGFREHKHSLLAIIHPLFQNTSEQKMTSSNDSIHKERQDSFFYFEEAFRFRKEALHVYSNELQIKNRNNELTQPLRSIFDSVIHMHCNRLLGNVQQERKARLFAQHTLKSLNKRNQSNLSPKVTI